MHPKNNNLKRILQINMKNKIFTFVFSLLIITTTLTAQELLPLPLRQKEELKARSWVRETPFEQVTVKEIGNRISALSINQKTEAYGLPKMAGKPIKYYAQPSLHKVSQHWQ